MCECEGRLMSDVIGRGGGRVRKSRFDSKVVCSPGSTSVVSSVGFWVISTEARIIVVEELRSPAVEAISTTQRQQRALSTFESTEVANN